MKQCLLDMEDLCNHELNTAVAAFVRPSQSTFQHMSGGTLALAEELLTVMVTWKGASGTLGCGPW